MLEVPLAHGRSLIRRPIEFFSRALIYLVSDPSEEKGELFWRDKVVDFIPMKIHRENR